MTTINDLKNIEFEQKSLEDWKVIANNSLKNLTVEQLKSKYYEKIDINPYYVKNKSYIDYSNIINNFHLSNKNVNNNWELLDESEIDKYDFIDVASFYYEGSNSILEIAYALIEGLKKIQSIRNDKEKNNNIIYFKFTCSDEFYNQISKIRAFKLLFNSILNKYNINDIKYRIYVENNKLFYSNLDIENNILRQTTQLISSIIAGINGVIVSPYDGNNQNTFSKTISKNINYILKHESGFDKVLDASGGSFFIEKLTLELADKSFTEFQSLYNLNEEEQTNIYNTKAKDIKNIKLEDFSCRKKTIIGVNKYTKTNLKNDDNKNYQYYHDNNYSSIIEKLRKEVDNSNLGITIANFGDKNDYKLRNGFTNELFSILSFNIEILAPFETLEDALTTLSLIENRIIIVSTSDDIYKNIIPELAQHLASKTNKLLFIVGYPKEDIQRYLNLGLFGFINKGQNIIKLFTNLTDTLKEETI